VDTGHLTANFVFVFYYYTALSVSQSVKSRGEDRAFFLFLIFTCINLVFGEKGERERWVRRGVSLAKQRRQEVMRLEYSRPLNVSTMACLLATPKVFFF
jgi:hypothetical protein